MKNDHLVVRFARGNLIMQICIGIILGIALAILFPETAKSAGSLGRVFVNALKAVAPILVFILVLNSIVNQKQMAQNKMGAIITLYLLGAFFAALIAVILSFIFPVTLSMVTNAKASTNPPQGILEVLGALLLNLVDNPINALKTGNYISILGWAIGLGLFLRHGSAPTKALFEDLAASITQFVRFIIRLAPFGIFGLVASMLATTGFDALFEYIALVSLLLGAMLIVAFITNPLLVYLKTKQNPYPLVFQCLRESGLTAFFTRSSAANIPVNMTLCKKLNLNEDIYSIAIPVGATINMSGAAITITIMALAVVHTLNIEIDFLSALVLSAVAVLSACGASGVPGGSLLLIPLACNLFGISNEVAMQAVGIGFIISVLQDSTETALNSSTDVLFTAAVCQSHL